ncbi:hypothetical protein [Aequorivita sinensis]|uniref:hypothetical protein n=1 Tax=Aequorivita sinensis TaxID=1382458 RepID=UPI0011232FA6|nr:hypothetical protein [Aequorivita sinensis]
MSSDKIQQSLINIEENLKSLESARNQVLSSVDSSSKLSKEVLALVESFNDLKNNLLNEHENILGKLEAHQSSFKKNVSQLTEKLDGSVNSLVDKVSFSSESLPTKLNKISKDYKKGSEDLISQNQEILNSIINKHQAVINVMDSVKDQLNAIDFYEQTTQIIQNQTELKEGSLGISKELNWIKEAIEKVDSIINDNFEHNFRAVNKEIISINESLLKFQKKQTKHFIIIVVLIIVSTFLIYINKY